MNNGKIGLCLTGGGARGIGQAGQIKAFTDLKLEYDMLVGCSVGSLNGTLLHQGEQEKIIPLWKNLKQSDIYTWMPWDIFKPLTDKACLYDSSPLEKTIRSHVDFEKIKANPKPFYIGCTDLKRRRNLVLPATDMLDQEEYIQFLKGSSSPPIFFSPANFRGSELGDGGISDNFNIETLRDNGCDTIIVLYPTNSPLDPKTNVKEMVDALVLASTNTLLCKEIKAIDRINSLIEIADKENNTIKKINLVVIQPNVPIDVDLLDFNYKNTKLTREDLLQIGYDSAYNILKNL